MGVPAVIISLIEELDSEKSLHQSKVVFEGEDVMSTETATRNLVYTSSDTAANFSMQLSVGPLGQVTPPGGGDSVPGWQIISGSITFSTPDGTKISQPINGTGSSGTALSGQVLVAGNSLFGIVSYGLVIGGGSLYIGSTFIDGTQGYFINFPPNGINIAGITCTPWPPGVG